MTKFLCLAFLFLTSCVSKQERREEAEGRSKISTLQNQIKKGMSITELREVLGDSLDCRGKPENPSYCTASIVESRARRLGIGFSEYQLNPPSYYSDGPYSDKYRDYEFHFIDAKLSYWKESVTRNLKD